MTSRRSRLKAVTNLPVRRKPLTSQGSTEESTPVDNLVPQKVTTFTEKPEAVTLPNSQKENEHSKKESSESENTLTVNCANDLKVSENCSGENAISKTHSKTLSSTAESITDSSVNLPVFKANNSSSSFKSNRSCQPNLLSSKEKAEIQNLENEVSEQSLGQQNCITLKNNGTSNNSDSNCNINVLETVSKCYTVLEAQNVTLHPVSEFTLTPLTPCDNTYIDPNVINDYPTQEYEEVQIYTDIESSELYVNEESVIEAEPLQSIPAKIPSNSSENEICTSHVNFQNLDSKFVQPSNVSFKSNIDTRTANYKNNFGNIEDYRNTSSQTKNTLENSVTSGSYVPHETNTYRQSILTTRRKRSKCNDFTKKLADARREFQKKYEKTKPDRSTLKMIDLIFYNPATNPMESKNKFEKKDSVMSPSDVFHNLLAEEKVDEPDALDCSSKSQASDIDEGENVNKMPVPQVKIGLDGEIILDEKSVVIETTEAKRGREGLQNSVPVFEDRGSSVSYYRGKSRKSRDWTDFETKRFYKALNTIGPDFSLMQNYFPKRSRLELKNKFKREEKLNRNLIDKALNNPSEFDMTELEKDLAVEKEAEEEEIEMRLHRIMKRNKKKHRVKSSRLSRELIESDEDSMGSPVESCDTNSKQLAENDKNKKKMEFDFVLQKLLVKN